MFCLFFFIFFFLGLTVTCFLISMEFCWFAICAILAFVPWILAEEKLLYQTPNDNDWGGWEATTNRPAGNVIKLFLLLFNYSDYKHPICQRAAALWCSGCIIVDPPSLWKDTSVRRAPLLKCNGLWSDILCPYSRVILHLFWTSNLFACTAWWHTAVFRQSAIDFPYLSNTAYFF